MIRICQDFLIATCRGSHIPDIRQHFFNSDLLIFSIATCLDQEPVRAHGYELRACEPAGPVQGPWGAPATRRQAGPRVRPSCVCEPAGPGDVHSPHHFFYSDLAIFLPDFAKSRFCHSFFYSDLAPFFIWDILLYVRKWCTIGSRCTISGHFDRMLGI